MRKRTITLSLLVALGSSAIAAEPTEVIIEANEVAIQGDIDRAVSILERAIDESPESLPLYNALARIYTMSGDLNEAERVLRIGISERSEAGELFENLLSVNELRVAERYRRALGVVNEEETINHVTKITEGWHVESEVAEAQNSLAGILVKAPNEASVAIVAYDDEEPIGNAVAKEDGNDNSDTNVALGAIDTVAVVTEAVNEAINESATEVIAGEGDDIAAIVNDAQELAEDGLANRDGGVTDTQAVATDEDTAPTQEVSQDVASENDASGEVASEEVASEEVASEEVASEEVASEEPEIDFEGIAQSVIETWRLNWSNRDAAGYVAVYTPDFSPSEDMSHVDWVKDREQNFASKSSIDLTISDMVASIVDDRRIRVRFTQKYKSNNYSDLVAKRITLLKVDNRWLIEQEISTPIN